MQELKNNEFKNNHKYFLSKRAKAKAVHCEEVKQELFGSTEFTLWAGKRRINDFGRLRIELVASIVLFSAACRLMGVFFVMRWENLLRKFQLVAGPGDGWNSPN